MSYNMHVTDHVEAGDSHFTALTVAEAAVLIGNIILGNLPTDDPENAGDLWNNNGVLTVSAG